MDVHIYKLRSIKFDGGKLYIALLFLIGLTNGIQSNTALFLEGSDKPYTGDRVARHPSGLYESDGLNAHSKPQLQASHEKNHTILKCIVQNPKPNAEVYMLCPALRDPYGTGHCYQGCKPTEPCSLSASTTKQKSCVPDDQTVFCEQRNHANGTTTIELKIDRSDPRLAGVWSCMHAGLQSTKFEVSLETSVIAETGASGSSANQKPPINPVEDGTNEPQKYKESDQRPLAYMRKPVILFTVLGVLVLSVVINLGFCIRCLIMRSYIDAQTEGSSNANCLANCLCLPKEMRKISSLRMTPVLPRSTNWGSAFNHSNLNGSYQGSAGLLYPSAASTMQKVPLIMQPQPQAEMTSGMAYYPAISLGGTLGRQGSGQRLYHNPLQQQQQPHSHSDVYPTSQLAYAVNMENSGLLMQQHQQKQHGSQEHSQGSLAVMNELGKSTPYMPSYIRIPSVNAPSPSMSHKLLYCNSNNPIIHTPQGYTSGQNMTLITDGHTTPQYFLKLQPSVLGTHVVYDDVAAGNSSIMGQHSRSPNQSLLDAASGIVQMPQFYQIQGNHNFNSADSTSNMGLVTNLGNQPATRYGMVHSLTPTSGSVRNEPVGRALISLPPLGSPTTTFSDSRRAGVPSKPTTSSETEDAKDKTEETDLTDASNRLRLINTECATEPIIYSRLSGMAPLAREAGGCIPRTETNSNVPSNCAEKLNQK